MGKRKKKKKGVSRTAKIESSWAWRRPGDSLLMVVYGVDAVLLAMLISQFSHDRRMAEESAIETPIL